MGPFQKCFIAQNLYFFILLLLSKKRHPPRVVWYMAGCMNSEKVIVYKLGVQRSPKDPPEEGKIFVHPPLQNIVIYNTTGFTITLIDYTEAESRFIITVICI